MIMSPYCGRERYDVNCICGKTDKCKCSLSFIKPATKPKK